MTFLSKKRITIKSEARDELVQQTVALNKTLQQELTALKTHLLLLQQDVTHLKQEKLCHQQTIINLTKQVNELKTQLSESIQEGK